LSVELFTYRNIYWKPCFYNDKHWCFNRKRSSHPPQNWVFGSQSSW
jgi:hypothetical protein